MRSERTKIISTFIACATMIAACVICLVGISRNSPRIVWIAAGTSTAAAVILVAGTWDRKRVSPPYTSPRITGEALNLIHHMQWELVDIVTEAALARAAVDGRDLVTAQDVRDCWKDLMNAVGKKVEAKAKFESDLADLCEALDAAENQ